MSPSVAPSVQAFLEKEAELRARHGAGALYVRPKGYAVPNVPGAIVVIGGWAFFDGDPALLVEGMDLIVITAEGPDGATQQLARDPAAVLALLAPFTKRHATPCPHLAVRVPRAQLASVRARVAALPEHDPLAKASPNANANPKESLAPPTRRELFPVLKQPDWTHKDLVVWMPFPGLARADAPIVTFAEDTPKGYVFLTRQEAPHPNVNVLLEAGLASLRRREADFAMVTPAIAVAAGRDLAAERILDDTFLTAIHEKLGPEMWVCVPHRVALYALRVGSTASDAMMFVQLVEHDAARAPELGHAPVSKLAFRVVNGRVVDAVPLAALTRVEVPPVVSSGRGPRSGSSLPPGVLQPQDVVFVDHAKKQINAVILLAGSGAKRFARTIFTATGGVLTEPPNDAEIEHYVLGMGEIRGWKVQFLFYAGDDSLGGLEVLAEYARHAVSVVLVQESTQTHIEPGILSLARAAKKPDAVVAFVGPASASVGWAQASGAAAAIVEPLDDRTTMDTLKKIAKLVLGNLRAAM